MLLSSLLFSPDFALVIGHSWVVCRHLKLRDSYSPLSWDPCYLEVRSNKFNKCLLSQGWQDPKNTNSVEERTLVNKKEQESVL